MKPLQLVSLLVLATMSSANAELLWREDFKETPADIPVSQAHVANPNLELFIHGPGFGGIKKSHHDWIPNDPYYVWSGVCPGNWAVTFKPKQGLMDLSQGGKVRWRSRQSGFRLLRIVLRLEDGTWLVSDLSAPETAEWEDFDFDLAKARWRKLDIHRVAEAEWVEHAGLAQVAEVGLTDLMAGGGSAACSRVDWIEVHGRWKR